MKAKPTRHPGEVTLELSRRDEPLMVSASSSREPSSVRLKKILVPTDFSECARKALQYAIAFARDRDAAITLLYVIAPNYAVGEYGGYNYATLETELRTAGEGQLADLVLNEIRGEIPADTLLRTGPPVTEITTVANEIEADLIVISTHGRTGLKHVLLGSVAEAVVRRAPCPVLVVREHEREFIAP
jgi:universal stress protein A